MWCLHCKRFIFDLKLTIKGSIIMKWGHGCKIWDWSMILHYFTKYLTCMLTLGLRLYRSSNLVIDLKMWEKFESNLLVWSVLSKENPMNRIAKKETLESNCLQTKGNIRKPKWKSPGLWKKNHGTIEAITKKTQREMPTVRKSNLAEVALTQTHYGQISYYLSKTVFTLD